MAEKDTKDKKEEAPKTEAPAEAPAKAGNKKLFIIIGAVVALVLLIGVPVIFFVVNSKKVDPAASSLEPGAAHGSEDTATLEGTGGDAVDETDEGTEAIGALFPMETLVVNLQGGRFLRCQIQLEFVERDIPIKFYSRLVPIKDGIISALTKRNADDVLAEKGKEGLKKDLKDLVNESLRKEEVKNVYFTQFVVQ